MACDAAVKAVRLQLYEREDARTAEEVRAAIGWWHIDTIREALDALVGARVAGRTGERFYPMGPPP